MVSDLGDFVYGCVWQGRVAKKINL